MSRRHPVPPEGTATVFLTAQDVEWFDANPDRVDSLRPDERHRQLGVLLEHSPDAIVMVDGDGVVSEWNPTAEILFGTPRLSAIGSPLQTLFLPPHGEHFNAAWLHLLAGDVAQRFEVPWSPAGAPEQITGVIVAPIRSDGALIGAVMILRHLRAGDPLAHSLLPSAGATPTSDLTLALAETYRDGPAGLPGRRWLQRFLSESPAAGLERGAAMFDIDAFAMVMSTYGPDAADAVLHEFGELLKSLGTPGEFAHWRADSFAWVLDTADPAAALNECVAKLTHALEEPFMVGSERVWLNLHIGLATTTLVADGDLLAAASDALQFAKRTGASKAAYYEESMGARPASGFRLANDLHTVVTRDELRLHYQPIIDCATAQITGVEALVRWERPEIGLLGPHAFIDVAERTGQIIPIGNWVVQMACKNAPRLGSYTGGPRTMSINISARQLRDPGLIGTLSDAMAEGHCSPSTIVIEVTESVLLHDLTTVAAALETIKALDVGLDLDDFGTGYSSLQYLKNLPIDRLKVDQVFVAGLGVDGADTAIVASTIALAHALGLKAIAEGVETYEQLSLLRELDCDFAQGFLFSRPVEMDALLTWLTGYVPGDVLSHMRATSAGPAWKRDEAADLRDTEADLRDTEADKREDTADDRERVADLRDVTAAVREHAEDDRADASLGSGGRPAGSDSTSTRHAAKLARRRATGERRVEANDRTRAGKSRDEASTERANVADARVTRESDAVEQGDE